LDVMLYHLVAICDIKSVSEKPVNTIKVNFLAARNVLKAAKDAEVERVLAMSDFFIQSSCWRRE